MLGNHRGEQLTFRRIPASPAGPLEVRALYIPGDGPPPRHSHPNQDVSFDVIEGALRVWVADDEPFVAAAGDRFEIPAGTVYAVAPEGDEPCRFDRRIDPALRSELLFRRLWRLNADRPARIGEVARVLLRHRREYRLERPPGWMQRPLFAALAAIDVVQGWLRRS